MSVQANIKDVFSTARVDELIAHGDEDKLMSIVMKLTGGEANPAVVRAQIQKRKETAE